MKSTNWMSMSFLIIFVLYCLLFSITAYALPQEGIGYAVTDYTLDFKGVDEVGFLKVNKTPDDQSIPLDQVKTNKSLLLLDEVNDMLHVRVTGTLGYLPRTSATLFYFKDLFAEDSIVYDPGIYLVGSQMGAGIYCWTNLDSSMAQLEITLHNGQKRQYIMNCKGSYKLYLPEGAWVTTTADSKLATVSIADSLPDAEATVGKTYTCGRYLVGFDMVASPYAAYSIQPLDNETVASYKIATFLYDSGTINEVKEEILSTDETIDIYLFEGDFIELNNCIITRVQTYG